MRENAASHYELGGFYSATLKKRLWPSQNQLAKSLGISVSSVSRAIALTRIPPEVIETLGGAEHISFRIGELLLGTIDQAGERVFIARVREAARLGYAGIDEFLEFVIFERMPECMPNKVRVRLTRDKRSLRVEIPDLDQLLPHLPQLEAFISRCFVMFEAELANHAPAALERARRRLRTNELSPKVGT